MKRYVYKNDKLPKRPCNICNVPFQMHNRFARFCEPCKEGDEYKSYGYGEAYKLALTRAPKQEDTKED